MNCQWCREYVLPWDRMVVYCAKLFHAACFDKLKQVAGRTGGVL